MEDSSYTHLMGDEDPALGSHYVFQLVDMGDLSLLESLVRKSPEVLSEKDEAGGSLLHHAAAGGHVTVIQFITAVIDPEELNSCDEQGSVPLHWAVERNQAQSCRALLDLGADPNLLNMALMSPLHLAVSHRHNNLVELLLSCSAMNADLEGDLGNTPVMLACSLNNCEALNMLLKHGARLCRQNKLGHFAIHAAAFAGAKQAIEVILKAGEVLCTSSEVHINYLDKSSSSPLHLAVRGGNLETIRYCIAMGAKIDQLQIDRSTALHFACTQGAAEAVQMMLSSYSPLEDIINIRDGACQTPLHRAAIFDHAELAEYLISMGGDINSIDCKGHCPLLLATNCGAWRTVALLLSKGANVNVRDRCGCNFLHLAILQPKGLKNLTEEVLQRKCVKELLCSEDNDGCTPLHYACRLGVHESVRNMLGLSGQLCLAHKSKDKKSALHFAAQYGRISTCQRLLETLKDSRLLNEGDNRGLTPLHLASGGGHTKVVELLLRKGALFLSDYKGWSCLHHAASEGYTQTMDILLSANIKLLDKPDEDGNTALHIAAREGHVAAVKLMLTRGAEILLNKNDASFLHDAIRHGKKDVVNVVIDSDRCDDAMRSFKIGTSQRCPVEDMIESLPETCKHLLDRCMTESDDDTSSPEYNIEYDFTWLQAPVALMKYSKTDKTLWVQPLKALNGMVQYKRIELLTHPVCHKYLEMKWLAYGSMAHMLNMLFYLLGLLPLTYLMVNLKPTLNTTDKGNPTVIMVPIRFTEQDPLLSISMVLVLVMNIFGICKEVMQMSQQRWNYFKDSSNSSDWLAAITSLSFVIPLFFNVEGSLHWQAGAFSVMQSWVCFLLYFRRFEHSGIYIVMLFEIIKTLFRILILFGILTLAYGLFFHALMLKEKEFSTLPLSVMQTFVMMVGELNYQNNFLGAYLNNELAFPELTYLVLVSFTFVMAILLMNLMIGLAVGDIAEVQRNATLQRIAMQIDLHTGLEEKLPYWFMKRVDKPSVTLYPNRKRSKFIVKLFMYLFNDMNEAPRLQTNSHGTTPVEKELQKQKYRLKEMSSMIEKQHNLLKLIIQKMEISSELDEHDGPEEAKAGTVVTMGTKGRMGGKQEMSPDIMGLHLSQRFSSTLVNRQGH